MRRFLILVFLVLLLPSGEPHVQANGFSSCPDAEQQIEETEQQMRTVTDVETYAVISCDGQQLVFGRGFLRGGPTNLDLYRKSSGQVDIHTHIVDGLVFSAQDIYRMSEWQAKRYELLIYRRRQWTKCILDLNSAQRWTAIPYANVKRYARAKNAVLETFIMKYANDGGYLYNCSSI